MEDIVKTRISELETLIDEANQVYRFEGRSLVPDSVYDGWMDELAELDPENSRLTKVGETPPDDERKDNLPLIMASMNKVKSYEALKEWMIKKGIPMDTILCITPKYDGLSILNDVKMTKAWTRGDGSIGQISDPHFKDIMAKYPIDKIELFLQSYQYAPFVYTTGEAIIPKELLLKNHKEFDNGRNRVGGLFNKYKPENKPAFNDTCYMRYGFHCGVDMNKSSQLNILNQYMIRICYRKVYRGCFPDSEESPTFKYFKVIFPPTHHRGITSITHFLFNFFLMSDCCTKSHYQVIS